MANVANFDLCGWCFFESGGLTFAESSQMMRASRDNRFFAEVAVKRVFLAPAKINLRLQVLSKREDGYHDLCMVMQCVSLYDRIELSLSKVPGVRVSCPGVDLLPGTRNIAARAAEVLIDRLGKEWGVDLVVEKNIPVAAGLGGGSSDAAVVLQGLNDMLGAGLSRDELMSIGSSLGADVPFFLYGQPAIARGIGDLLQPLPQPLPDVWYVLVNPGVAVSTAWVYQNLGLTSLVDEYRLPGFPKTAQDFKSFVVNDLERVTMSRYPEVGQVKSRLSELGALAVLTSGSGPTVFGVFHDQTEAEAACRKIRLEHQGWRAETVRPV